MDSQFLESPWDGFIDYGDAISTHDYQSDFIGSFFQQDPVGMSGQEYPLTDFGNWEASIMDCAIATDSEESNNYAADPVQYVEYEEQGVQDNQNSIQNDLGIANVYDMPMEYYNFEPTFETDLEPMPGDVFYIASSPIMMGPAEQSNLEPVMMESVQQPIDFSQTFARSPYTNDPVPMDSGLVTNNNTWGYQQSTHVPYNDAEREDFTDQNMVRLLQGANEAMVPRPPTPDISGSMGNLEPGEFVLEGVYAPPRSGRLLANEELHDLMMARVQKDERHTIPGVFTLLGSKTKYDTDGKPAKGEVYLGSRPHSADWPNIGLFCNMNLRPKNAWKRSSSGSPKTPAKKKSKGVAKRADGDQGGGGTNSPRAPPRRKNPKMDKNAKRS